MAMTLTVSSGSSAVPTGFGSVSVSFSIVGTATPVSLSQNLASGANTITVPTPDVAPYRGVLISPPAANAVALTLKGVSGDTGLRIPENTPFLFLFDGTAVPANFVINAASATTGNTSFLFF